MPSKGQPQLGYGNTWTTDGQFTGGMPQGAVFGSVGRILGDARNIRIFVNSDQIFRLYEYFLSLNEYFGRGSLIYVC